jgi:hypothetical protein
LVQSQVFGMPPQQWLESVRDEPALRGWAQRTDSGAARLVRAIAGFGLEGLGRNSVPPLVLQDPIRSLGPILVALSRANADQFIAAPQLGAAPCEVTPLVREAQRPGLVIDLVGAHGNGLLPRLGALIVELARAACEIEARLADRRPSPEIGLTRPNAPGALARVPAPPADTDAAAPTSGLGLGLADAARGLLLHWVQTQDAAVSHYRILAPTEWNFHPRGTVAKGLEEMVRHLSDRVGLEELERRARLHITAVDPCVAYRLVVS